MLLVCVLLLCVLLRIAVPCNLAFYTSVLIPLVLACRKWHKMQKEAAKKKRKGAKKYDASSLQQMKLEVDRVYGGRMR